MSTSPVLSVKDLHVSFNTENGVVHAVRGVDFDLYAGKTLGIAAIERVLIHDCARAFTPPQVFRTVAQALTVGHRAVIPVVPVIDTIKTVDAHGTVTGTPSRALMRAVQTPQGFRIDTLRAAHEHSRTLEASVAEHITDDAMAVEAYGEQVHTVTGHTDAFKITTPLDLRIARALYPTAPESARS